MSKIKENIAMIILVIIVLACSVWIGLKNQNIGEAFLVYNLLLCGAIVAIISIYKTLGKATKESIGSIVFVMVYFMFLFAPTVKMYLDLPDFLKMNLAIEEGTINEVSSTKAYLNVNINELEIQFWGWDLSYDDFEENNRMKVYYLKRSKLGVDYEIILK